MTEFDRVDITDMRACTFAGRLPNERLERNHSTKVDKECAEIHDRSWFRGKLFDSNAAVWKELFARRAVAVITITYNASRDSYDSDGLIK